MAWSLGADDWNYGYEAEETTSKVVEVAVRYTFDVTVVCTSRHGKLDSHFRFYRPVASLNGHAGLGLNNYIGLHLYIF